MIGEGNRVDAYPAENYQAEMESMEGKLTHYLREGEMWRASEQDAPSETLPLRRPEDPGREP